MSISHPLPPPLRPYSNGMRPSNVHLPVFGELIMIRLPFDMHGPPSTLPHTAINSGASRHNYHPCVVRSVFNVEKSWEVNVYGCRLYGHAPDPVSFVRSLPPN